MNIKEEIEKEKLSTIVLVGKEKRILSREYEILEEKEDYIITSWHIEGKLDSYIIFYKINNKVYQTETYVFEMKKGESTLRTWKKQYNESSIIGSKNKYSISTEHLQFELLDLLTQRKMIKYIDIFISYISKLKIIRIRAITGSYEWNFSDSTKRRSYNSLKLNL